MYIGGPFGAALDFPRQESLSLSGGILAVNFIALAVSLLLFAFFTSAEAVILAAERIRTRHLAEQGSKGAQALERLRTREDRFFAVVILGQNAFVIIATALGTTIAIDLLGTVGIVLAPVIMTLVVVIFGEMTPKVLAVRAGERYALLAARPVEFVVILLTPVVRLLAVIPNALSRLVGLGQQPRRLTVTEGELRMLIGIGTSEGALRQEEGALLERVFRFRERQVNEVMVPRTEVIWLEKGTIIADFYRIFAEHPHSRFPIYSNGIDDVVGIVGIKDVLRAISRNEVDSTSPIEACMRPAFYVPETKAIGPLFWQMQRDGYQMAIVVDEYGGTAGIVTTELLLEEIVGELGDELRPREREFEAVDERSVQVDGGMSIHDANEELDLGLPEGEYETVAGFVLSQLGHIPREGEQLSYNSLRLVVTRMHGRKIERVLVTRL
ncbi:MAG: hemolysin family protein [Dehalococcoidia bacterium]